MLTSSKHGDKPAENCQYGSTSDNNSQIEWSPTEPRATDSTHGRISPSTEVLTEAIMTLLSGMTEVETSVQQRFTKNAVKIVFVISPGYAALPEQLQFVYTMVTTLAEGRFGVVIPAPNGSVDCNTHYPLISHPGFRGHSKTRVVLDEVRGLNLSSFARLLKLRPGVNDDLYWYSRWWMTSGSGKWILRRNNGQTESDIIRGGSHGIGLEDKAAR